jgi:hypothetical protein
VLLHPAIAALRSDDAPQRQAQRDLGAAIEAWRTTPAAARVMAALSDYGTGHPLVECKDLAALFAPGPAARLFASSFAAATARALGHAPLGQVPLRHFTDGAVSTLLLARSARAALFLTAVGGPALAVQPAPVSVGFAATEAHEAVLAGSAQAQLVTCGANGLAFEQLVLEPGTRLTRDCTREALILREVRGSLVSLRLQRRAEVPQPTREIELASGRLIHQAAASAEESRTELMIALLGRMKRADAAPVLAAIARRPGPDGLRWQALRECLGLDTAIGFAVLSELAASAADPLAAPATALRNQLISAHPQLAGLEPCPA